MSYYKRISDILIQDMLTCCGAIEIQGPKWCGKSTTAEQHARSVVYMQNQETKNKNILLAKNAPGKFLEGETPRLIDEWQEVAFIRDHIRFEIDQRKKMGQFILTGSATPLDDDAYSHSGIGRIVPLRMRTMSLYESKDSTGEISLTKLFDPKHALASPVTSNQTLMDYAFYVCRGGWPQIATVDKRNSLRLVRNFYDGLIHEDVFRVFRTKKYPDRLKKIMKSYARAISTQTSLSAITEDAKASEGSSIDTRTVSSYLDALRKLYIVEELSAWNPNLRSKSATRTASTRHFVDPSIACAALGIGPEDLIEDMNTFGLLFESMCVRDLRVFAEALDGDVYHYRDSSGLEADAVVHLRNGEWGAVEVKLRDPDGIELGAKHLLELANKVDTKKLKKPSFLMVLTASEIAYQRPDGVYVVPIGLLGL